MFLSFVSLCTLQFFMICVHSHLMVPPVFESEWLPIKAQSSYSDLLVDHGLGEVPGMVEVLVKAIDGPNEGFIFKAAGSADRDDDSRDAYGGVIYIYNDVSVHVMAPNAYNDNIRGGAIYTGEAPYFTGINNHTSLDAEVKVRCWSVKSLPETCLNITNLHMKAGSPNVNDTYIEVHHNHTDYPSVVKVRAKMIDGYDIDWYSDAQGSSKINYKTMATSGLTGGLKFAYNNDTIRVWTSSYPAPVGMLFYRADGWGNDKLYLFASEAYVEIFAWCDLVLSFENKIQFGSSVVAEEFEVSFPALYTTDEYFISVTVQAVDGPNQGYLFEGAGSAMPNTINIGQPCAYGGLVYAHNDTSLRFWRPDHATGAAICIPDNMGFGTNSQASQNGILLFRVYWAPTTKPVEEYQTDSYSCSHFTMLGNHSAYNSTASVTEHDVSTLLDCHNTCRRHEFCMTFSYNSVTCQMYNTTNELLLYDEYSSQVWGYK